MIVLGVFFALIGVGCVGGYLVDVLAWRTTTARRFVVEMGAEGIEPNKGESFRTFLVRARAFQLGRLAALRELNAQEPTTKDSSIEPSAELQLGILIGQRQDAIGHRGQA